MKIELYYNLAVMANNGVMFAGIYEEKEENFPEKLQREIQLHRDGKQPKTTLEILEEDKTPKKRGRRRRTA